jgi:23S rRNA (uridine2552-2'-O)-methyltransferase
MAAKRPKKNKFVKAWLDEHLNDPWVREATRQGYRSRAAFKLLELAERDRLFRPGMSVVDLGAAPGSWTQVLREKLGSRARIVALDVLDMAPLPGVVRIQGDFRDEPVVAALEAALEGRNVDLVVSDLAPNLSGIESADQARAVHLGELALEFACRWLEPGGDLVVKAFQGAGFPEFHRELQRHFSKVYVRKPKASRDRSREVYLVAKGHKTPASGRFDRSSGGSGMAEGEESGPRQHEGLKSTPRRIRPRRRDVTKETGRGGP